MDTASLVEQFENVLSTEIGRCSESCSNGVDPAYAENILKLHLAASELLSNRYDDAKQRIAKEYSEVMFMPATNTVSLLRMNPGSSPAINNG